MSKITDRERKYKHLMALGMNHEDALQVLADDDRIDKGEKLFELTTEGKQAEKKYKNCGVRTVSPYGQVIQKEKKIDTDKRFILNTFYYAIEGFCKKNSMAVLNEEREFEFVYNDRKFKMTLSCPRNQ